MPMLKKDDNILDNYLFYKDKKFILEIESHKNLVDKSSDTENYAK